jgi:hypothetical protein
MRTWRRSFPFQKDVPGVNVLVPDPGFGHSSYELARRSNGVLALDGSP